MKIYDCLIFFNELDLLEMRMEILNPHVDYFVITESPVTFSGQPKPLYFDENKDRFKKFEHKIIHNVHRAEYDDLDAWQRERGQRNSSADVLQQANNDDIIVTSDVDEIPNFDNIDLSLLDKDKVLVCHQDFYYYYLNTLFQDISQPKNFWKGTRIIRWGALKNNYVYIDNLRDVNSHANKTMPEKLIDVPNAGWHFSFLGGADKIRYKIESYSHQEMNTDGIKGRLDNNLLRLADPFGRPTVQIYPVPITEQTHPKYLIGNLKKYDEYIYKETK